MTTNSTVVLVLCVVAFVELLVILLQRARIAGLEDRYWVERQMRIKDANRHPFCAGTLEGESDD